jgi:hypothetical protein
LHLCIADDAGLVDDFGPPDVGGAAPSKSGSGLERLAGAESS